MILEQQILFLFSALGALNGIFLCLYFSFFSKKKEPSDYFLSALLLVVSIRILKSAFFYFNTNLSEIYIQIGLSACFLTGPLLYYYIESTSQERETTDKSWLHQILIFLGIIITVSIVYPYKENYGLWTCYFVKAIYLQWLVYLIISGIYLKNDFIKLTSKKRKLNDLEI